MVCDRIVSTPNPKVEVKWTDIGSMQGSMVIVLVAVEETHLAMMQDSSLLQFPRRVDPSAIIVSIAAHVSADCPTVSAKFYNTSFDIGTEVCTAF